MIQEAHKKADKGFNDFVAQLYEQEFKTQEKAKYEYIKQAKEKALEEQQKLEEEHKQKLEKERQEAIDEAREMERKNSTSYSNDEAQNSNNTESTVQTPETPQPTTSSVIGNDWASVSPEVAANYMESKTGVSASKWLDVIYKESSGNPYVTNPIGCYGLLQINQNSHGNVSGMTPQEYLDTAVNIYESQGGRAWQVW